MSLEILHGRGPEEAATELDRLWSSRKTFLYVPEKSAVSNAWLNEALLGLPAEYHEDHFCLLTSGSTGIPKLVIGNKLRSERLAAVLHRAQDSEPVRATIVSLPLTYCYAFVNQWLWSRISGRRLLPTPGLREPDRFRETLRAADDAMLCLVGPQIALLRQFFGREVFPGVIRLHFAGGRFPQEQLPLLREVFPNAAIYNNYGCAEAMPRLALRLSTDADTSSDIGRPLPGIQFKTGDSDELLFLSDYRCVAQVDGAGFRPIADGQWVPSGDLARSEENGRWHLLGRAGDVFKRYGEKIAVPQMLATVSEHWRGQVSYYRDKDGAGEDGYALVLSPAPAQESLHALLQAFRSKHPRTHWPLRIESVEALPLLSNGKVDTLALGCREGKALHWRQRI